MSDNRRRFLALHAALRQFYPTKPSGNLARHLNTLAMLISGIVGSKQVHLPAIASKVPTPTKPESRVKRFSRWVDNERIDIETYDFPYAQQILTNLAHQPLVLIVDSSPVGRKCRTLMLSVVSKKRALPIGWLVVKGNQGHFAEEDHIRLVEQVAELMPEDAEVRFLGDGEFDGVNLLQKLESYGWKYVCRTAKNTLMTHKGETLSFEEMAVTPGMRITLTQTKITRQRYGPLQAMAWWEHGEEHPLYLVSNLPILEDPGEWYAHRTTIETFFSDQKSRGFQLQKSHLSEPERLKLLMMAACLAYIWVVYLGAFAMQQGLNSVIHRTDRCDLSLFQLGLRLLEYYLNEELEIPADFHQLE